jgi:hypothetical protein
MITKQWHTLLLRYIFTQIILLCFLSMQGMAALSKPNASTQETNNTTIWCFTDNDRSPKNIIRTIIKPMIKKLKTLAETYPDVFFTLHKKCMSYPSLNKGHLLFLKEKKIINSDDSVAPYIKELMNAMICLQGSDSYTLRSFKDFTEQQLQKIIQLIKTVDGVTITEQACNILHEKFSQLLQYPKAFMVFHTKCKHDSTDISYYPDCGKILRNLKLIKKNGSIPPIIQKIASKLIAVSLDHNGKPEYTLLDFYVLQDKGFIKPYEQN